MYFRFGGRHLGFPTYNILYFISYGEFLGLSAMADLLLLRIEVIAIGVIFACVLYWNFHARQASIGPRLKTGSRPQLVAVFGVITAPDPTQLNSTGRRISEHVQNSPTGQKLRFFVDFSRVELSRVVRVITAPDAL